MTTHRQWQLGVKSIAATRPPHLASHSLSIHRRYMPLYLSWD
jgi:hypothetical protein